MMAVLCVVSLADVCHFFMSDSVLVVVLSVVVVLTVVVLVVVVVGVCTLTFI